MDILLHVPYTEKDLAKSKGARWNPNKKSWYINDYKKLPEMTKWLSDDTIICENLFLLKKSHTCWKCKSSFDVVLLATDKSYAAEENFRLNTDIQILTYVKSMPDELTKFLQKMRYYPSFSKQVQGEYYINHCCTCKMAQGDHFLHEVPEQAFYRKLCYSDSEPISYAQIHNKYCVSLRANLPYYDDMCSSMDLILHHMKSGIENRASLMIDQESINDLFENSIKENDIEIDGL